jgi:hypothetical protein
VGSVLAAPKQTSEKKVAILMYTAWNLWKEPNRRVSEGKTVDARQVVAFIK